MEGYVTGKGGGESRGRGVKYDHLQPQKNLCTCLKAPGRKEGKQGRVRLGSALFVEDITVQTGREGRLWLVQEHVISTG